MKVEFIEHLRTEEMRRVLSLRPECFHDKEVLEIGSGTGVQLEYIATVARSCIGVDLPGSDYTAYRHGNIIDYDGESLPFAAGSFDTVFSSNVMEHIRNQAGMNAEIKRVLRSGGRCVHVVPTASWRLLTSALHWPGLADYYLRRHEAPNGGGQGATAPVKKSIFKRLKRLVPERHGELGNWFTEYFYFSARSWRHRFERLGWKIEMAVPAGLAYSGHAILAYRLSTRYRTLMAKLIGSSCMIFVLTDASRRE
jgi:SAM-dependent methyltransferase